MDIRSICPSECIFAIVYLLNVITRIVGEDDRFDVVTGLESNSCKK